MAGLFAFGCVVQYNDPDPLVWVLIYIAAASVCIAVLAKGRVPVWAPALVGAVALLWGLAWSRTASANQYLHMFDYWEMKSPGAEEARETSGLLIIAGWMAVLATHGWLRQRVRTNAR